MINQKQSIQNFWKENLDQISSFLEEQDQEIDDIKVSLSLFCRDYDKPFYTDSDLNLMLSHSLFSVGNEKKLICFLKRTKFINQMQKFGFKVSVELKILIYYFLLFQMV